jgi:hypothetical protein
VEVSHRLSLVEALATASAGELAVGLGPLAAGYEAWLDEQQTRVAGLPGALVLLNLPALTDPAHPERVPDGYAALVDLLFYPTGGGKTEAYLGLAAYTFAIRRLQGVAGGGAADPDGR